MSPVFAHGHLRLYLLVLLADHPMHGYEVIQALGDRFGGTYVPSAGTVYPRLAKLEEEGLVTKSADGRKTVYAITDAGRAELDARADEIAAVENGVNDSVKSLADGVRASVGEAMRSLRADLAASAQAPRGRTADEPVDVPSEGARALREVEMVLSSFRQQVRADLRRRATRGTLGADTVTRLRDGLEALRKSL
ncbi:DNA-binding PadR family transcriptional regulator [Curtobacterium sp. 320]|jgi:DNA-binding PadR family transcriptional regulator|uniref:PadR family transcriptional regulator n=1 Tax=unclassified Curtobacterium TaxID=257496 RepID=UPI0008DCD992|nr:MULTISPECIES: PadR family transcriptional regulator [unclassified Curtobacterium]MCC8907338.1 helix-turn-helix transcriptional regulator [Curtobacterium sp. GD1]MCT9622318.1 helix-turn-helix transcriptional regulator [Curtobacterium sp. C2H10]MDR6575015.1 DNA-binding PadR family transcriptional regulator [Curtobacterium sp. 320]OII18787.1 PadR family transcriptional regulator [Curtobacterium sp. MCBA15_013]OII28451.1 PadR family transcriptional regulator [Curtobacterium sp. MCBA15_016]